MKSFKEFREDFKDELFTSGTADLYAYMAYCQGYAEAKSEIAVFDDGKGNYFPLVPNPYDANKITCDFIARTRNLSEEERKAEFASQVEELKQDPNSVLNAMAMQKAAEKVEEK